MRATALTLVLASLVLSPISLAQTKPPRLQFSNSEVADIVHAISKHSGANIVYGGPSDTKISLNVVYTTPEEALRYVTVAAANILVRKIGNTFVVATPETMRRALEPFGDSVRLELTGLTPADAAKVVEAAYPYVTVRPFGSDKIQLIGSSEDLASAAELVRLEDTKSTRERAHRELVPLKVANGKQVADMVANMYPGLKAEFVGDEKKTGGAIGLSGPADLILQARQMIETVDNKYPFPEFAPKYQVYDIRYSSAPRLKEFLSSAMPEVEVFIGPEAYSPKRPTFNPLTGVNLGGSSGNESSERGSGGAGSPGSGGSTSSASGQSPDLLGTGERSKYIVLRGPSEAVDQALALLAQVDVKPQQVVVEVKVVDTSPERAEELGLKWNWTRFGFYEAPSGTAVDTTGSGSGPGTDFTQFTTKNTGFGMFSRVPWSFENILQAMVSNKEAKLLANPSIQVLDNDEANIFIGDTIRARTSTAGGLGTTSVEIVEFPVGIILLLRPRVNADGNITMRVHPVVSTVSGIDAQFVPQTSTREAETTVMVKDGETVVIGGLIRDEMSKVIREVPFLSKLPLIGELFKSRSTSSRKSEVLIFITPRIITDGPGTPPSGYNGLPKQPPVKAPNS